MNNQKQLKRERHWWGKWVDDDDDMSKEREERKERKEKEDESEKEIAGSDGEGKPCQTHVGQKCQHEKKER